MKLFATALCILSCVLAASATVYFEEQFGKGWEDRWVMSTHKGSDAGDFDVVLGNHYGDAEKDKGLHTTEDYRFYQTSAKLSKPFDNTGKDLIFQYTVKHQQNIDCGGGYFKLLPGPLDQEDFNGDSEYHIMFGPDHCGGTKKCHVIFNHDGKNHLIKKTINAPHDTLTHLYALHVHPDQSFEVFIDGEEKLSGSLTDEDLFDILPPKKIADPSVSKPADWVDEAKIKDPEASKPEGYDDIPEYIIDPEAEMPDDWDEELDGEWEAPEIPNPEYKGPWVHPMIDNPDYKGPWEAPMIDNPDYKEVTDIYAYKSSYVGVEVWQVKAGTIFDNLLVTDSADEAESHAKDVLARMEAEKAMKEKEDEERRKQEEEEAKAREAELDAEDDEDEDEDDHTHDEL